MRSGGVYHDSYRRPSDWHDYLEDNKLEEDEMFATTKQRQGAITSDAPNDGVGGIKLKPLNCDDNAMIDYVSVALASSSFNSPHDKPLFLACGLHKPHMPWDVPKKYYQMYPLADVQLPKVLENDLDDVPPAGVRMALAQGDHAAILKAGRWKDAVQGYLATITFCDAIWPIDRRLRSQPVQKQYLGGAMERPWLAPGRKATLANSPSGKKQHGRR